MLEYRLNIKGLDEQVKDMLILGKLEAGQFNTMLTSKGKDRKQQQFRYAFRGIQISEKSFRVIHDARGKLMRNLKVHFKINGAVPRIHGNKDRFPSNTTSFEDIKNVLDFILHHADVNGLPMPAATGGSKGHPPTYLSTATTKASVHLLCKKACVCLFVCGISLTSGQLISELFPDCTRSCFSQVVSRRRGGDRIYEMRCLICSSGTQCPLYSAASLG